MSQARYACYSDITNPTLKNAIGSHCLSTVHLASLGKLIEPQHDKSNQMTCVPSEDSDQTGQPGHRPCLSSLRCALIE